jgi:hypothetical protein
MIRKVSTTPQQLFTSLDIAGRPSIGIEPKIVPEDVFEFTVPFQEIEKKQIPNLNILNKQRQVMQQPLDYPIDEKNVMEGIYLN